MKHTIWKVLLCLLLITSLFSTIAIADKNLDEIERYDIIVNVRQDGTLDMKYEITWKVLSDKNGKEPLSWVLVGIPNEHVDQIQALTDNIKTAVYSHDRGGDFIRIDFTKDHYEGEVITFSFAIHQSYMYMLDEEDVCRYSFTPGWFEQIEIKELHILWNNNYVVSSDAVHKDDDYLEWYKTDMEAGEHFEINVRYHLSTFDVDESMQYQKKSGASGAKIVLYIFLGIVVLFLLIVIIFAIMDEYGGGSGFGGGGGVFISSCAHSSCACAHSCACACACAGGGRAGCSAKDFYNTKNLEEACK